MSEKKKAFGGMLSWRGLDEKPTPPKRTKKKTAPADAAAIRITQTRPLTGVPPLDWVDEWLHDNATEVIENIQSLGAAMIHMNYTRDEDELEADTKIVERERVALIGKLREFGETLEDFVIDLREGEDEL